MPQRRTVSICALLLLAVFAVAPVAVADSERTSDRAPSFLAAPLAFLGTWFGHLLGFETAADSTQTTGCGEAGPHIDPDGRCAGSTVDAAPDIDPDGH